MARISYVNPDDLQNPVCPDSSSADDEMWKQMHPHFTGPELVGLGSFIGYIAGSQRWISTLGIGHGEVLAGTTVALSPDAVKKITRKMDANA